MPQSPLHPSAQRLVAALALLAGAAAAQRAPSWVPLHLPGGVDPLAITQLGKLVLYDAGDRVYAFSAFTRTWTAVPRTVNASVRQANDWALIQDGSTFTAFSSMLGSAQTLQAAAGAVVLNPANQRNDSIILVRDGETLHAFSGLTGRWLSRKVSPNALVAVQRSTALVADGTTLLGMSALRGRWVELRVTAPITSVYADGETGIAEDGSTIHGFSAQLERWTSSSALAGAAPMQGLHDVAVWTSPNQTLAYSGLVGRFASVASGAVLTLALDSELAVARTSNRTFLFSAIHAAWTPLTLGSGATLQTAAATALFVEADRVHAYSALTAQIATLVVRPSQPAVTSCVAALVDAATGRASLYSAMTGSWHAAPAAALAGPAALTAQSAALPTAGGFLAFSARSGQFVPLATGRNARAWYDGQSAVLAVEDPGTFLHVFEARRDAWLSVPVSSAAALTVDIWRTTLLADDGTRAIGFGAQAGEIETVLLPEPTVERKANSECARVATTRHLLAYSPVPDLASMWQFPEFRRVFTRGTTFQLQVHGELGAIGAVAVGLVALKPIDVPALGTLCVDLATAAVLPLGTVPIDGRIVLDLPVPDLPALIGTEIWIQGVMAGGSRSPYLTRAANLMIR